MKVNVAQFCCVTRVNRGHTELLFFAGSDNFLILFHVTVSLCTELLYKLCVHGVIFFLTFCMLKVGPLS